MKAKTAIHALSWASYFLGLWGGSLSSAHYGAQHNPSGVAYWLALFALVGTNWACASWVARRAARK